MLVACLRVACLRVACLLDAQVAPWWSKNSINRLEYYVLQLGDINPNPNTNPDPNPHPNLGNGQRGVGRGRSVAMCKGSRNEAEVQAACQPETVEYLGAVGMGAGGCPECPGTWFRVRLRLRLGV